VADAEPVTYGWALPPPPTVTVLWDRDGYRWRRDPERPMLWRDDTGEAVAYQRVALAVGPMSTRPPAREVPNGA
jgi:hypothetical protein